MMCDSYVLKEKGPPRLCEFGEPTQPKGTWSMKPKLSQSYLKSILDYNPDTGVFTWRERRSNNAKAGAVAGGPYLNKSKRQAPKWVYRINIDNNYYYAQNLAWCIMTGEWPSRLVDHKENDARDNRWCNLRLATVGENAHNAKIRRNNTSGVKGVSWAQRRGKWIAKLQFNHREYHVGYFETLEAAEQAIRKAREELHGDFANHG